MLVQYMGRSLARLHAFSCAVNIFTATSGEPVIQRWQVFVCAKLGFRQNYSDWDIRRADEEAYPIC